MTFVSLEFFLFFSGCCLIFFSIPKRWKWLWLLICSYGFYGYHNVLYLPLLLLSTAIDYWAGIKMGETIQRQIKKRWLYVSLISNLGLLIFFKYFNFLSTEISSLITLFGTQPGKLQHNFLLPLGISFYTFQTLGYSIDVYRGYVKPERHFGKYALYVSFFPQLVAGPIERARKLLPQLDFQQPFDYQRTVEGLQLILWGLFKKLVIADRLGLYVSEVFEVANNHQGPAVILGTLFFGLQILFDFAAYSEMAIGLARILGVQLSKNFGNASFFTSPIHMWSQWHITLTTWFRDYVYFPLTKRNKSKWATRIALFITFLITGLWHGASWGFVIWGGLHGAYLVFDHLTLKTRKHAISKTGLSNFPGLLRILGILAFLPFNMITGFFFRAESVSDALTLMERSLDFSSVYFLVNTIGEVEFPIIIVLLITTELFSARLGQSQIHQFFSKKSCLIRWTFYFAIIQAILFLRVTELERSSFIYFEF